MNVLALGDELHGRTLDVHVTARSLAVGITWERHPSEAQFAVHLGPLVVNVWWASWWREMVGVRRCRVCGCTEDHACPGGCWWVEDPHGGDLCSTCFVAPPGPSPRIVP